MIKEERLQKAQVLSEQITEQAVASNLTDTQINNDVQQAFDEIRGDTLFTCPGCKIQITNPVDWQVMEYGIPTFGIKVCPHCYSAYMDIEVALSKYGEVYWTMFKGTLIPLFKLTKAETEQVEESLDEFAEFIQDHREKIHKIAESNTTRNEDGITVASNDDLLCPIDGNVYCKNADYVIVDSTVVVRCAHDDRDTCIFDYSAWQKDVGS